MTNPNINLSNLSQKSETELAKIAEALSALKDRKKYHAIDFMFPDDGPYSRNHYPKHMEFFKAGALHKIRCLLGGNGTGKSKGEGSEAYYHLSGKYPYWWEGLRFNKPIKAWICARENKQMRESIQEILFGPFDDIGSGLIPKEDLLDDKGNIQTWAMSGTANCIGSALVKHYDKNGKFDGHSLVNFKTYAQGWQEFQGATRDFIWLDEEPDDARIYSECLARTRGPKGKEGSIVCTFTPLLGFSTLYLSFMPNKMYPENGIHPENPNKHVTVVTWNDVPHLSEEWKKSQIQEWALTDPNSIEARTTGLASVGTGRIFPVSEAFIKISPFKIPEYWPRAFGLDFGWNNTAAVWVAEDPMTKVKYVYAEYKRGKIVDSLHVQAILSKGKWIAGGCDPHSGRRDGGELRADYFRSLGLNLMDAESNPGAGNAKLLNAFESGALKIFDTCQGLLDEIRSYHYDQKQGNVPAANQDDHEIDSLRYLDSVFDYIAKSYEDEFFPRNEFNLKRNTGRDSLTGY